MTGHGFGRTATAGWRGPSTALVTLVALGGLACGGLNIGKVNAFSVDDEWRLGERLAVKVVCFITSMEIAI